MPIVLDGSGQTVWAQSAVSAGTITSAAFSPVANSLLLVAYADENSSTTADATASITNTGTALTWTRVAVSNQTTSGASFSNGTCFFWAANTSAQSGITVTVTPSAAGATSFDRAVIVKVITGAAASPVGASGVGFSTVSGNLAVSYTATVVGSLGFLAFYQAFNAITLTAGTATTIDAQLHTTSNNDALLARETSVSAGLTTQTLNVGTSGASQIMYSYLEIVPSPPVQAEGAYNSSAMTLMRG